MAGELKTRIVLTGGQEIKKAFSDLGTAGVKAFTDVQNAATNLKLDSNIGASLAAGGEALDGFGRRVQASGLFIGVLARSITSLLGPLALVGAAGGVASLAIIGGFTAMAKSAVTTADAIKKIGEQAKISGQSVQGLQFAGVALGGTADTLTDLSGRIREALVGLQGNNPLREFATGAADAGVRVLSAANDFERGATAISAGIRVTDAAGVRVRSFGTASKDTGKGVGELEQVLIQFRAVFDPLTGKLLNGEQALVKFADGFAKLSPALQEQVGLKLFGSAAAEIVPVLRQGGAAIREQTELFKSYGLALSDLERENLRKAGISFRALGLSLEQAKAKLGALVAPAVTQFLSFLSAKINENAASIQAFAEGVLTRAKPLIDDFFRALNGERVESGTLQLFIDLASGLVTVIRGVAAVVLPVLTEVKDAFDAVAKGLKDSFGVEVSGATLLFGAFVLSTTAGTRAIVAGLGLMLTAIQAGAFALRGLSVGAVAAASLIRGAFTFTGLFAGLSALATTAFTGVVAAARVAATGIAVLFTPAGLLGVGIAAALAGIVALTVIYWDEIKEFAAKAFEGVKSVASAALDGIAAFIKDAADSTVSLIDRVVSAAVRAKDAIAGVFTNPGDTGQVGDGSGAAPAPTLATPLLDTSGLRPSENIEDRRGDLDILQNEVDRTLAAIEVSAQDSVTRVINAFAVLPVELSAVWEEVAAIAVERLAALGPAVSNALLTATTEVRAAVDTISNSLTGGITAALAGIEAAVTSLIASINAQLQALQAQIAAVIAAAQQAQAAAAAASSAGGGSAPAFAGGGFVRGPGTSTSDSIWAKLSDSEFVQRAKAVRYYGVDVMHMLNQLRIPADALRGLLGGKAGSKAPAQRPTRSRGHSASAAARAPGFAMGGLVRALGGLSFPSFSLPRASMVQVSVPAFAGGGLAVARSGGGVTDRLVASLGAGGSDRDRVVKEPLHRLELTVNGQKLGEVLTERQVLDKLSKAQVILSTRNI